MLSPRVASERVLTPLAFTWSRRRVKLAERAAAMTLRTPSNSVSRMRRSRAGRPLRQPAVRMIVATPATAGGSVAGFVMSPGTISIV